MFSNAMSRFIQLHDYADKKIRLSSSMSKLTLKFNFCESVTHSGTKYLRIRPNSQTYKLTSKKFRLPFYMVQCDREDMAISFFPHKKFIQAYMKDKISYSSISNSIFAVSSFSFIIFVNLYLGDTIGCH